MFKRRLTLPPAGARTFFLWGPRQVGKTTLLRQCYPDAFWVDLLKADEFRRYATRPESLRLALQARGADRARQVVVDEVLKVPALLDEAHWMIAFTSSGRISPTPARRSGSPTGGSRGGRKWTSSSATCGRPSKPRRWRASARAT